MSDQIKYFTPVLSDFYDGYEFCMFDSKGNAIFRSFTVDMFAHLREMLRKRLAAVPYLTANLIQREGLQRLDTAPIQVRTFAQTPELVWFTKNEYVMSFAESTCMLGVYVILNGNAALRMSVRCRDINRFRMLIQMMHDEGPSSLQQATLFDNIKHPSHGQEESKQIGY